MSATIEFRDDVAVIEMDDGKANVINQAMLSALNTCLDQAERMAKAVLIAGRDQRFSGGFDLSVIRGSSPDSVRALMRDGGCLLRRVYSFPLPVVAACTGHAVAMGSFLLLSCDIRYGARGNFKIGANESAINMVLPAFAVELLRARLGPAHLTNAAINANLYDPDGARAAGFLDDVVEPGMVTEAAMAKAIELCALAGPAFASNKKLIREATLNALARVCGD